MRFLPLLGTLFGVLLAYPCPAPAEEDQDGDFLGDQSALEEEQDFPDLVRADEDGGIMDELDFLQEEDLVYTAAKHEQRLSESPSAISVITREQIENTACLDVICLLRQVPEVDVIKVTTGYVAVGARSLTSAIGDKVLVLVDGMEINEEVFGLLFWQAIPVHLEDIERIEVIRGPGSALYGANAHSAVVSITTRKTTESQVLAFAGGGEHDNLSLYLKLEHRLDDWGFQASVSKQISGIREISRIHLRVARENDQGATVLQGGFTWEMAEIYTKLGWIDTTKPAWNAHVMLSHKTDSLKAQVYFRTMRAYLDIGFPVTFQDTELGRFPDEIDFLTTNLDAEIQYNWSPWKDNLLIAGGNYRWNSFFTEGNKPEETHQHRVGLFLQNEQILFESLTVTAGLRFDYNNITPEAWSPRLAAVWEMLDDHNLRAAFGRAFRKPSLLNTTIHFKNVKGIEGIEEFFEKNLGNPDLNNESITTLEIGYIGHFFDRRLTAETDLFYNHFGDTIAFNVEIVSNSLGVPDLQQSIFEFRNEGMEVDSLGGCIMLSYRASANLRLGLNYTLRYSWYLADPGDITGDVEGVGKGDRVPWEPAHLLNASMHFVPESGFRFGANLHAASATDVAWTKDGSAFGDPIVIHNPARFFASAFVAWRTETRYGWWEAGVRAYNTFNQVFRDYPTVRLSDGSELGGQRIGRRMIFFLRTSM